MTKEKVECLLGWPRLACALSRYIDGDYEVTHEDVTVEPVFPHDSDFACAIKFEHSKVGIVYERIEQLGGLHDGVIWVSKCLQIPASYYDDDSDGCDYEVDCANCEHRDDSARVWGIARSPAECYPELFGDDE